MNMHDLHHRLVDLYAGDDLPTELEASMEALAASDPALAQEMAALRRFVRAIRADSAPQFTEETSQRILLKLYARGVEMQRSVPEPVHLQYQLPIQS